MKNSYCAGFGRLLLGQYDETTVSCQECYLFIGCAAMFTLWNLESQI